jgi:hypothetical protein
MQLKSEYDADMHLIMITFDLSHRKGHGQIFSEKGVCLVYLDMLPVNLTEVTKELVRKKCPGMVIRCVPAGGTGLYQVDETIFESFLSVILLPT